MRTCAIGILAIGGCLLAAPVDAREGDLDPAFGDVGRVGPIASVPGTAWSMVAMEDGGLVIGGGEVKLSCPPDIIGCVLPRYVGLAARSFLIRFSDAGQLEERHEIAATDFHLLAIARQTDGRFLAAGRRLNERSLDSEFVVYRLNQDGSLDTGFGVSGLVRLPEAERGEVDQATAVLVEPDGRVVVAGSRARSGYLSQIVIRLLANGDFDSAFGSSGMVVLPGRNTGLSWALRVPDRLRTHVLRTDAGTYRVSVDGWCQVVGLTPGGAFDSAFGSSGIAQIDHPISNGCFLQLAMQADGRLVVGASDGEAAVVTRLLADGQPDPSFLAGTGYEDRVGYLITALAVGPDGSIVVALGLSDWGYHGLEIKRLLPSGELHESFGNAGSTAIDMPSEFGSVSLLFDMLVREDGTVLGAGGNPFAQPSHGPIIVQLLGADGGDGPGVLGVTRGAFVDEEVGEVVLEVRRTGGSGGDISTAYRVAGYGEGNAASAGEDFVADAGRLEWDDGDMTSRTIRVRILNDDRQEDPEQVAVRLSDAQGGAGLGRSGAIIEIQANDASDGPGRLGFLDAGTLHTVTEGNGAIRVAVARYDGSAGRVSMDYETRAGTATAGVDFTAPSGTVTWEDGETLIKFISIGIVDDGVAEGDETFTIRLSNPTGGATINGSQVPVAIRDNDTNDGEPEISVAGAAAAIGEAGGSVVLTVVRSGAAVGAVSVDYATAGRTATAGSDFVAANGTLHWADGDSSNKSIRIDVTDDGQNEGDETFTLTLSNPSGAVLGSNSTATVTITDNDPLIGTDGDGTGGGGALEFLSLLYLGLIAWLRSSWACERLRAFRSRATACAGSRVLPGHRWLNEIRGRTGMRLAIMTAVLGLILSPPLLAEGYRFSTVDYPDSEVTELHGINARGTIVGMYVDSEGVDRAFSLSNGVFKTLEIGELANATLAHARGINARGDIVGNYSAPGDESSYGFLISDGRFHRINPAGSGLSALTLLEEVNNAGDITGSWFDQEFNRTHFIMSRQGTFRTLEFPPDTGGVFRSAQDNGRVLVGYMSGPDYGATGFIRRKNGEFEVIPHPEDPAGGCAGFRSINQASDIVGSFAVLGPGEECYPPFSESHGFLLHDGEFTYVDYPGIASTEPTGINDDGVIIGRYYTDGRMHGFKAVPRP